MHFDRDLDIQIQVIGGEKPIGMCGSAVIDFLAHGLVDNSFFLVDLAFAFYLTLALVAHLAQNTIKD